MDRLALCVILSCISASFSVSVDSEASLAQKFERLERSHFMLLERQRESDQAISNLKAFTSQQARTIQEQAESIQNLKEQLAKQDHESVMQMQHILKNEQTLLGVKDTCDTVAVNRDKRQSNLSTGAVAFTVYNDVGQNPQPGEIVKYNDVVTNEGGAFDIQKGVFTAPKAGLYFFIFTVGESHIHSIWLKLVVNNEEKVDAAVDTFHQNQDLQGSNAAVLRLRAGDQVWVGAYENTGYTITGGERLTTFTGVFLSD